MKLFYFSCFCLSVFITPAVSYSIPEPCQQLQMLQYQKLCAEFLQEPDNTGGVIFANASAVNTSSGFRSLLEQEKPDGGQIIVLTGSITLNAAETLFPQGFVAVVGNPANPPGITIPESSLAKLTLIHLLPYSGHTITDPQFFASWGVQWIQENPDQLIIFASQRYGTLRLNQCHFDYQGVDFVEGNYQGYIVVRSDDVEYYPVHNHVYIISNRFTAMPSEDYSCIQVYCEPQQENPNSCVEVGDLVIKDNIWEQPVTTAPGEQVEQEYSNTNHPSYKAIYLRNTPRAEIVGNRVSGPVNHASIYVFFTHHRGDGRPKFNNLDISIIHNYASDNGNFQGRQIVLKAESFSDELLSSPGVLAGTVNITGNICYDIELYGGFATHQSQNLTLILANNDCNITDAYNLTSASAYSSPIAPSASVFSSSIAIQSTMLNVLSSTVLASAHTTVTGISTTIPAPSVLVTEHGDDRDIDNIAYFAASAAGVVVLITGWQIFWNVVYRYSTGNTKKAANLLALFIPGLIKTQKQQMDIPLLQQPFNADVDYDD